MPIFHIDSASVSGNQIIITDENLLHRLKNVRRVGVKERVFFFKEHTCFETAVDSIEKSRLLCTIQNDSFVQLPHPSITLINAVIDKEPMETIIRLNVPYYVEEFSFFRASRSNFALQEKTISRLRALSLSVAEQSEVCFVPSVREYNSIQGALYNNHYDSIVVLNPYSEVALLNVVSSLKQSKNIGVVVGPEGGFTEDELDLLEQKKAVKVKLNSGIYRSEFAGFAISSLLRELL
jgi:16S rRNA (uracil1498-N3)-methyltransferase